MHFEWDEVKRLSNIAKHGIDFIVAASLLEGIDTVKFQTDYKNEPRFMTISKIDDLYITIIWTKIKNAIRIISARRSRYAEKRKHQEIYD